MTPEEKQEFVQMLVNNLGTAAALFTMEYNESRDSGGHLDYGLNSKLEPILTAELAPLFALVETLETVRKSLRMELEGCDEGDHQRDCSCYSYEEQADVIDAALAHLQEALK